MPRVSVKNVRFIPLKHHGHKHVLLIYVVAVVLTLTRIIKSVVTGQAPVTLELRNTPTQRKQTKSKHVLHGLLAVAPSNATLRSYKRWF